MTSAQTDDPARSRPRVRSGPWRRPGDARTPAGWPATSRRLFRPRNGPPLRGPPAARRSSCPGPPVARAPGSPWPGTTTSPTWAAAARVVMICLIDRTPRSECGCIGAGAGTRGTTALQTHGKSPPRSECHARRRAAPMEFRGGDERVTVRAAPRRRARRAGGGRLRCGGDGRAAREWRRRRGGARVSLAPDGGVDAWQARQRRSAGGP